MHVTITSSYSRDQGVIVMRSGGAFVEGFVGGGCFGEGKRDGGLYGRVLEL